MTKQIRKSSTDGYIYQLPSGRWRSQICIDGRRLSATRRTKAEARQWVRDMQERAGMGSAYLVEQTRLEEFLQGWLERKKFSTRAHSYETYESLARTHILPELGKYRLDELSPGLIQGFIDRKVKSNIKPRTVQMIYGILHNSLDQACKLGLIIRNPVSMVQPPRPAKNEMSVWDEREVNQFLAGIQGERYEHLYALALSTGLRQGELLGLKWQDLDWKNGQLQITRQAIEVRGGGFAFSEPKSRRGTRCLELGEGMLARLRDQILRVELQRKIGKYTWQENDLVFPSLRGTAQQGAYLFKDFKRLIDKVGLRRIRFHDMRHTAATLMLSHRIPPMIVAGILGDSLNMLLNTYAHFIPSSQGAAMKLMDEITTVVGLEFTHELPTEVQRG